MNHPACLENALAVTAACVHDPVDGMDALDRMDVMDGLDLLMTN